MEEQILMSHVVFGMLGVLAGVWIFVEVLNASEKNMRRIKYASIAVAVLIWLAYFLGGYWYVSFYAQDKTIINAGPWPWAHAFFMEAKEHMFFNLLLLSTYLPIIIFRNRILTDKDGRKLVLIVAGLIVLFGLAMEGFGAVISMGVKMGLLVR